jgi:ABC-2 type transport system permease protein
MTVSTDVAAPPAAAPAPARATRPFYWSVRRELWENRSLYMAPLIAAAVVLFGFTLSALHPRNFHFGAMALDPAKRDALAVLPYYIGAMVIIVTGVIVGAFYCLGALHNERRDRSILFWKSLPVSDLVTVASKAFVPLVILPAVVCVVAVVLQLIMLALNCAGLLLHGVVDTPATQIPLFDIWGVLVYGVFALALWYAPIWGWLLLISGFARRAPFLWAVLPPLALSVIEGLAFGTSYVSDLIKYRMGGFDQAFTVHAAGKYMIGQPQIDAVRFLSTPGLWTGLAVAAAFLAAAVWQRRYREPT